MLEHLLFHLWGENRGQSLCLDGGWRDGIDPDVLGTEIKGDVTGEVTERRLGGALRGDLDILIIIRHRRKIPDRTAAGSLHFGTHNWQR